MLRKVLLACVAALGAGLLLGGTARVLMRVVAWSAGDAGAFSWAGTAGILVVFVLAVLPGALLAALDRGRRSWLLLAAGAVFLCVPATGVAAEEVGSTAAWDALQWAAVLLPAVGVYATIAALPLLTLRLLDTLLRGRTPPAAAPPALPPAVPRQRSSEVSPRRSRVQPAQAP